MPSLTEIATKRGVFIGPRAGRIHVALYRRSRGRIGSRLPGISILLLDHTGARSGIKRTSPLIYVEDGANLAVTASKAGQPQHPAWFHNVKANPETTVQVGRALRNVRARVASDEERERLWPKFVATFRGYEIYQRYAKDRAGRTIPIVILEPR